MTSLPDSKFRPHNSELPAPPPTLPPWAWVLALVTVAALIAGAAGQLPARWVLVGVGVEAAGLLVLAGLGRVWPWAGLLLLVGSAALPRYTFALAGVTVNAERTLIPLVAAVLGWRLITRRAPPGTPWVRFGWSHTGLLVFLFANALGALLAAPAPETSLRLTLLIAVASLPLWLLPQLANSPRWLGFTYKALVLVGLIEAAFGLAVLGLYYANGDALGVQFDNLTQTVAPYGSQWEGNTFGSFVAAALVATLGWGLFARLGPRQVALLALALAVLGSAVALSLSRGAWLGAALGVSVVLVGAGARARRLLLIGGLTILVALIVLGLTGFGEQAVTAVGVRLGFLGGLAQGDADATTVERLYTYELAWQGWTQQPLFGWGAGAFGQLYTFFSQDIPGWIGNLELHALHDSGLVGLLGLLLALLAPLVSLARSLRQPATATADRELRGMRLGLLGACITLLVAYQTTEATWLAYTWVFFGLAWAAGGMEGEEREPIPRPRRSGPG